VPGIEQFHALLAQLREQAELPGKLPEAIREQFEEPHLLRRQFASRLGPRQPAIARHN
jgi:hypothetical protein